MARLERLFHPQPDEIKIAQSAFLQRINFIQTEPTDDLECITPENALIFIDQAQRIVQAAASVRTAGIIREETEHLRQLMNGKCVLFPVEKIDNSFDNAHKEALQ
jgi:hypothetical protein